MPWAYHLPRCPDRRDNGIYWEAAVQRPDLFLTQTWAICAGGDRLQTAILRDGRVGINYELVAQFAEKNEQVIEIYRRTACRAFPFLGGGPVKIHVHQSAWRAQRLSADMALRRA